MSHVALLRAACRAFAGLRRSHCCIAVRCIAVGGTVCTLKSLAQWSMPSCAAAAADGVVHSSLSACLSQVVSLSALALGVYAARTTVGVFGRCVAIHRRSIMAVGVNGCLPRGGGWHPFAALPCRPMRSVAVCLRSDGPMRSAVISLPTE